MIEKKIIEILQDSGFQNLKVIRYLALEKYHLFGSNNFRKFQISRYLDL